MSFLSSEESMERVASGTYSYIYFKSNLEDIIASKYTDKNDQTMMHISKEVFFPGGYAWAFPKVLSQLYYIYRHKAIVASPTSLRKTYYFLI